MSANMKLIKQGIIMLCMMLSTLCSYSQDFTDQQIGLDVERTMLELRERGFTEPTQIDREIQSIRELRISEYLIVKKIENEIQEKVNSQENPNKRLLKTVTDIPQSEKDALLALFNSTYGANWTVKTGWDFNTPVITENGSTGWYGLTVSNGHVISISLRSNNLTGPLPKEIGQLKYLVKLDLYTNKLSGGIPSEIEQLENLEILKLDYNNLTERLPQEIGLLKNLKVFSFYFNMATGNIPVEIGQLGNLQIIDFGNNQFTGPIPTEIGNLINLESLSIPSNKLSGSLPLEIGLLSKLINLIIPYNQISGTIPSEIVQLKKLNRIDLRSNQLTGIIPSGIGQLSEMYRFEVSSNKLNGVIPLEIELLKKLSIISLDDNQFTGNLPPGLGNLSLLDQFYVRDNLFTGSIPAGMGELKNLTALVVDNNRLTGKLPDLSNATKLTSLGLSSNQFRFIDFEDQFSFQKVKLGTKFTYANQSKTDKIKKVTTPIGSTVILTMCEDGKFMQNDTFQWYKNNILIAGATSRLYTLTNVKITDAGTYFCRSSHTNNPDMSPLVLEREPITLAIANCTLTDGTIKSDSEKFDTKTASIFSFQTTAVDLTYLWNVTNAKGEQVEEKEYEKINSWSYNFKEEGDYVLKLIVTDKEGCVGTFIKNITVLNRYCAKEPVNFVFETASTHINYMWTTTNSLGVIVDKVTDTTGLYTFLPELLGEYDIKLTAGGSENCETLFSKKITVEDCTPPISCTKSNPLTLTIKSLFVALVNKMLKEPQSVIKNGYSCLELNALRPYIKHVNPAIYNFKNNGIFIEFSFTDGVEKDVVIAINNGIIVDFNLDNYVSADTKTKLASDHLNSFIRGINFCPDELSCVSHVALVIDESGSIDPIEANKIKKQLKAFIVQQANTNDNIGSNIYVSITGMSDSDENIRTDFIEPTKLTNSPTVINQFNTWIDNYGKRNGSTGISASSDYWRSGLEGSLSYYMKPDIVLMITDGCQTADITGLKTTMKRFNNAFGSDSNLPHLYVVGIEKGFYVDESFYTNKTLNSDPNENPEALINTITPHLTKSLQFLLDLPATQFPTSDINQFDIGTYYGHTDFNLLVSDNTYFSDKLINAQIVCGTASIKDFCDDCLSFKPEPGKEYVVSAWTKEEIFTQVKTYENPIIKIVFYNNKEALDIRTQVIDSISIKASGAIIDGWQRMVKKIKIPDNTITIGIKLENNSLGTPVYFDDIRIHPLQGSVKSFVYDPETFKLMSELDENNYSTFYEYDNEGGLVRVKKETEKGIKTIQETRSGGVINTN